MCFKRSLPAASVKGPRESRTLLGYIRMCSDPPFIIENAEKFSQNEETPRREVVLHRSSLKSLIPLLPPPSTPTKVILTAKWRPNSILEALTMPQCSLSGLTTSGADKNAQIFKSFQLWVSIPAFIPCPFPHPIHSACSQ